MLMRTLMKSRAQQAVFAAESVGAMLHEQRRVRKQLIENGIVQVKYQDNMVITQVCGWTVDASVNKEKASTAIKVACETIQRLNKEGKLK